MNIVRILTTAALLIVTASGEWQRDDSKSQYAAPPFPQKQSSLESYMKISSAFVPNAGQTDSRVRFMAQAGGANFYFTSAEAVFVIARKNKGVVLRLGFVDANPNVEMIGQEPTAAKINYITGQDPRRWQTGLRTYGEIIYRDLWPGIDLKFSGADGPNLKYEFHLAPHANPNNIRLTYQGAKRLSVDRDGDLRIHTAVGTLKDSRPISYQMIDGNRVSVDSRYRLMKDRYGFQLGAYDPNLPLLIDPIIGYGTFLGGAGIGNDQGFSIAVDSSGAAYITGVTNSSGFPTTAGAFDTTFNGGSGGDVFVTKLDPSGSALVYSTYLGGSLDDQGNGIAVDGEGNVYITGSTTSTNFPTTPGAFDTTYNSGIDAFVTKLNADGSSLLYSTYLGGSLPGTLCSPFPCPHDSGLAIAVDVMSNAYVTGSAGSRDFPTTPDAFDTSYFNGSATTTFITKLNFDGSALIYSSFLGVSGRGNAIAVAPDGSAYVTGEVQGLPTTPGAFDTTPKVGFVTKFNAEGSGLLYSTYLGGSGVEQPTGIAIDQVGNAFVTGTTSSPDFPTTPGAFDTSIGGGQDAFVSKLNSLGSELLYGTYLGGGTNENCFGIAVDQIGIAYVTGNTTSVDFPTTPDAFDSTFNGGTLDVFLTRLNATGSGLLYSTYFGGASGETGRGVVVNSSGSVYLTGLTASNNFPNTPGSFDTTFNGGADAFVIKLMDQPPVASGDTTLTDEDNAVSVNVLANDADPDADPLTISEVTQGANGSVTINSDNTVTYLPALNFFGSDSFTYTIADTYGHTDVASVSVTINPVNDAPVASESNATTNEDESVQVSLNATDVDNSDLIFSVVDAPAHGTLGPINGSTVTYTPNANSNGADNFTFKANDGVADSNIATISLSIAQVNDPPDAVDDSPSTAEDSAVIIDVLANDTDVDANVLSITATSQPQHGVVAIVNNGTAISYAPASNFFGTDSFTYDISDGNSALDTATVNVTVTSVNDAPVASDDSYSTSDTTLVVAAPGVLANDTDIEVDVLSAVLVTNAANGALTLASDGSFTYVPNLNFSGTDSFTYHAFDGVANSNDVPVQITVAPIPPTPTPTPTPTPPPIPCRQEGPCFVFEYLGFNTAANGQTTITFNVTNKCKNAVRIVAIGTGSFTRVSPADGSVYSGSLGSYDVGWTKASGNPGFLGIKFEPSSKNFKNGATESFTIVVSNFNPNTTIQVKGVGPSQETFSFLLSQTSCPTSTAALNKEHGSDFTLWLIEMILAACWST